MTCCPPPPFSFAGSLVSDRSLVSDIFPAPVSPPSEPQDVRTAYFGSAGGGLRGASRPPSTSITLEWLWERCAYNAITFKSAHNLVVNVSLPCAGTRDNGAPFNGAAACGTNELLGWSEAAAAAARVGAPRGGRCGAATPSAVACQVAGPRPHRCWSLGNCLGIDVGH